MKIPNDIIPACYQIAKKVYESKKSIPLKDGVAELVSKHSMNPSSATGYIRAFSKMIEGKNFNRTLNADSFKYYLEHIFLDYGSTYLQLALSSLKMHIEYFESIENSNLLKVRDIYESYFGMIPTFSKDNEEQDELERLLKDEENMEEIISDLMNLKETDSQSVSINGKRFKRDNKTVVQIKILRNFKCQICNTEILKKDGSKYIEAAHIKPKRENGSELSNNILILCPNHHKEFDFGDCLIQQHNNEFIEFSLNGTIHRISLAII